ncbi:conserved Plasmodium membrane protein, unknown function [Plasmodium berghei]|uniref:Major facilitator superfamily domain-containing protein n=2 Tax=Plasmodium berghei TaxID=5821 RepID=A0A509AKD3_PLABA|nr:conserved Plasmodium membrane protein, unknown function [Plasmodium berghei ANKA]CXI44531.1 conserved Plasmodium membrane protein, unknown function [Plasmodium berghei]SCM22520.1 conserved Plasmodium membrane protein, unknown function [Plasmodium berghei]SCN25501.1 conserved Plasmodium membrane protein, unknown function [Plasmodium berghei]SCO60456.1 conserved Plasmodium membrane protein, unknown function [Plasmodium berghei]SCO62246.1 conserved Plasmodium membrane protein, unknown function|eukprot:XP_034421660.1 conserved Plasmodium membrane protein, unknown function [Plasmodium berghei ANKA]
MSEYKIKSSYFSTKNKAILLICVFFFSCSTHIFKNVFPFLFMLTSSYGKNSNNINEHNVKVNINNNKTSKFYKQYNNNVTNYENKKYNYYDKYLNILEDQFHINSNDMVRQNYKDENIYEKYYTIKISELYNNENNKINNRSIYLYSNVLSLIYISSLVTYIFILFFDLNKKKYILSSLYIINLISHCIIFLILNRIQINNTNIINNNCHNYKHINIINTENALRENNYYEFKRKQINLFFHINLKNNFTHKFIYNISDNPTHIYIKDFVNLPCYSNEMNKGCLYNNMDETQVNDDIYNTKHFNLLYLFIIISSVCSAYIKIYQKKILYCIFYLNLGVITSLLILMNSIFKIMAHSLNYIMSNNNMNINISDYILMFSFIDMLGLFIIFIFSYKWSNQKKLWINLSTIFYNYKYICFYINKTYYLYSTDKHIDNIIAQIDMCKDPNVDITFSAYINIEKSIFYDFFLKNKNEENKLNIIEIKDKNFKITTTYNTKNTQYNENDKHIFKDIENPNITPSYNRKKKHSHTIKPYKIHVEAINKYLFEEMENLTNIEKDENGKIVINKSNNNNSVIPDIEDNKIPISSIINNSINKDDAYSNCENLNDKNDISNLFCENSNITDSKINGIHLFNDSSINIKDKVEDAKNKNKMNKNSLNINLEINSNTNKNSNKNSNDFITNIKSKQPIIEEEFEKTINITEGEIEEKKNKLLVPNHNEDDKYLDYDNYDLSYKNYNSPLFIKRDKEIKNIQNNFIIFQNIKTIFSSFTFYFFFFIFIYAFLLSIMHIFINYFFYIYLFVFNINIYISNIYTIIMTFASLIAIPFSGYIIDNIGSFLFLLLCSSFFILIAISGTIYSCVFNLRSEVIAFISFNLIGISESIIPTVIISQIPTHLCVKKNEDITAAFAIFELVSMLIVSVNNYIFGYFLINKEYLNGLYILFVFVILVISLIFLLIFTIYWKARPNSKYVNTNNTDITQPLL